MRKIKILFIIIICNNFFLICNSKKNRLLPDPVYGTHMVPLIAAVMHTSGSILELGCGDYSTPLLHALCQVNKRFILTADTDKKWLSLFEDLIQSWHQFIYVPVYKDDLNIEPKPWLWDSIGNNRYWSVILIDHRPGDRRIIDIERLRNFAEIMVIHDTESTGYGYEPILAKFRYRYIYDRYSTQTTLVSDKIDVKLFFDN